MFLPQFRNRDGKHFAKDARTNLHVIEDFEKQFWVFQRTSPKWGPTEAKKLSEQKLLRITDAEIHAGKAYAPVVFDSVHGWI